MTKPKKLNLRQTNQFIKERGILLPNKQVKLTEPIFVFKKVKSSRSGWGNKDTIANLVIPAGAVVNLAQDYEHKMRTNQAYCYSIVQMGVENNELETAYSTHDDMFRYHSGKKLGLTLKQVQSLTFDHEKYLAIGYSSWYNSDKIRRQKQLKDILEKCKVNPDGFGYTTATCDQGVHFFIDLERAKNY